MNYISDILYWISTGLLVPVIVLLIFLFVRSLFLVGGFFGHYLNVKKAEGLYSKSSEIQNHNDLEQWLTQMPKQSLNPMIRTTVALWEYRKSEAHVQHLLDEYQLAAEKDLATPKMLSKMGPMLGLMGTLIPMGPALVGLSTGDIASMAYNMQVAFATTVVGLFAAAVGFVALQIKQRWYQKDLSRLEFIAEMLHENENRP